MAFETQAENPKTVKDRCEAMVILLSATKRCEFLVKIISQQAAKIKKCLLVYDEAQNA